MDFMVLLLGLFLGVLFSYLFIRIARDILGEKEQGKPKE